MGVVENILSLSCHQDLEHVAGVPQDACRLGIIGGLHAHAIDHKQHFVQKCDSSLTETNHQVAS
jgi:hypothetical protein